MIIAKNLAEFKQHFIDNNPTQPTATDKNITYITSNKTQMKTELFYKFLVQFNNYKNKMPMFVLDDPSNYSRQWITPGTSESVTFIIMDKKYIISYKGNYYDIYAITQTDGPTNPDYGDLLQNIWISANKIDNVSYQKEILGIVC